MITLVVMPCSLFSGEIDSVSSEVSEFTEAKYLSQEARQQWIAKMRNQLIIVKRQTGPFGLPQDLTVKKVEKITKVEVKPNVFPEAIAAMKISVVMGKSFLIGGQEYRQGGNYVLDRKGNKFNIKVILITSEQIIFQNTDTQERVVKELNTLPAGFQRDEGLENIPGFRPANKGPNTIELDE